MAGAGWPEIPALATGTSIMGSALSFLLVFRLSWSFGRWWEARGLIGTAMTKMRNLASMITANSDAPSIDQAMALLELRLVCKLHVATMVDILVQDAARTGDQKRMRASKSVRKLLQDLDKDELHASGVRAENRGAVEMRLGISEGAARGGAAGARLGISEGARLGMSEGAARGGAASWKVSPSGRPERGRRPRRPPTDARG